MDKRKTRTHRAPLVLDDRKVRDDGAFYLVHVTYVGAGRQIIDADQIEVRYCKHFGKSLVYFFLERPGYRPGESDEKSDQINRFPFVFITPMPAEQSPFHVYPFDTGAALNKLFDDKADPFVYLEDYELGRERSQIAAHINWAFGSSEAYFRGDVLADTIAAINPWDDVEKSFFDIAQIATSTHNRPDKRASAVEIAFAANIPITHRGVKVILPKQLLEWGKNSNTHLLEKMRDKGIAWHPYNWSAFSRPDDFFEEITAIVEQMIYTSPSDGE